MTIVIESRINPCELANVIHYLKETHGITITNKSQAIRLAIDFAAEFVPDVFSAESGGEERAMVYLDDNIGELNRGKKMVKAVEGAKKRTQEDIEQAVKNVVKTMHKEI